MSNLEGKVAIVTGAASGIGLDLALELSRRGASVLVCDVKDPSAAVAQIAAAGGVAAGQIVDIADEAAVEAGVAACLERFGRLDILVNNAGLFTTIGRGPYDQLDPAEWRRVMDVNVTGVWLMCRAARPALKASGAGRIINITSATAFSTPPSMLHYVTSKGAVTAMTSALARELGADNITVNAVAPGFTLSSGVHEHRSEGLDAQTARARATRAIARDQQPDDLVGAVAFFAGAESAFITGQTLIVDGGAVMR